MIESPIRSPILSPIAKGIRQRRGSVNELDSYASGFVLSAARNEVLVKESDVTTFQDEPCAFFTPDISKKYIFNSAGVIGLQDRLFRAQTRISSIKVPDGQGCEPGNGFTCTGLAWDGSAFWVGNDGGSISGDSTRLPSVVRVSTSGENLFEIDIGTLYGTPNSGSVQGVAYDTSDSTLWVAQVTLGQVRHVTTAGADIGDGFALAGANGLAYDSLRDKLWTVVTTALTLRNKNGTVVSTYTKSVSGDQCFYDAERDYIWVTDGLNGSIGTATAYNAADGTTVGSATFPDVTAIEGIVIVDGYFYIAHDGYYHGPDGSVIQENQIQKYPALAGSADVAWAIDYNPLDLSLRGYLVEQAFTRLNDSPIEINSWTATNCSVSTNNIASLDGTVDAERVTANAGTNQARVQELFTFSAGAAFIAAVVKAGTHDYVWLGDRGDVAGIRSATFRLSTKAVVGNSNSTGRVEDLGGGWLLLWIDYTRVNAGSGAVTVAFGNSSHTLDYPSTAKVGTETFYVWGGNAGQRSWPLSMMLDVLVYTRGADTPSFATSAVNWSATNNSFIFEATTARGTGTQTLFQAGDATDGMTLYRNSSNEIHFLVKVAGVTQADLNLGAVANMTAFKLAVRAKANDFAASLNGGAVVTDVSGSLPTVTTLRVGNSAAGEQWNAWVKTAVIIPEALTDATLIVQATA
jgi:hypothetical protein